MALTDRVLIPKRVLPLFFVVDTSAGMDGSNIGAVNNFIEESIPVFKEISDENADVEIKIAALEFSSGARWITDGLVSIENFHLDDLRAKGLTDFGAACKELNKKLSSGAFLKEPPYFRPLILLFSGSKPTDDYKKQLAELKKNGWFKEAVKFAVTVGDDADIEMLNEFTGSEEAVFERGDINPRRISRILNNVFIHMDEGACEPISDEEIKGDDW